MPSFEEEALSRAQQMHRRPPYYKEGSNSAKPTEQKKAESFGKSEKSEKTENTNNSKPVQNNGKRQENLLDIMFRNKEQSLILLLIVLLMEDNAEPSLLLALMYLLI